MEEWKLTKVSSICRRICSGGTPKSTVDEYYGGGIPWLNTKEVNFNRIYSTESTISEFGLKNSSAKWIEQNTVIVAMYGATAAKCAIGMIPMTTNQACCNLMIDETKADYRFVYYAIANSYSALAGLANGGAQQNLNAQLIKDFEIPLPSLETQKRVADILSTIDDKIENNTRINHNLEEQAQALFKSWFVDFEPFKDVEFVDSELGMIPKGWRVGHIEELISDTYNGDWGKDEETGAFVKKVFCIRGADIPSIRVGNSGKMPTRFIQEKHFQTKYLKDNDIVVEISGGSPTQSTGRFCRVTEELIRRYDNSLICTNFCKALRPKDGCSIYVSYLWNDLYERGIMFSYENGTTGIKNLDLNGLLLGELIVIPDRKTMSAFSDIVSSLNQQALFNGHESEKLSYQRDTLLPKLMSGEISESFLTC